MNGYPKIQTIFLRDPETKYKTLLEGQFALPEFEYLQDNLWIWTEKVDGTNVRINLTNYGMTIQGKKDKSQIPVFLLNKLQEIFKEEHLQKAFEVSERFAGYDDEDYHITLFGEGYGNRIQKVGEKYIPNDVGFILLDIRIGQWWLQQEDLEKFAEEFKVPIVPIVGEGTLQEAIEMTREGFSSIVAPQKVEGLLVQSELELKAEGLVLKPVVDLLSRNRSRVIAKIKHKDFQTKEKQNGNF